jgi:hypothetical protein
MTRAGALEIIAAYGGDPRRWPDADRPAVLALVGDPVVAAALGEARTLDAVLVDWARDVAPAEFDAAAIASAAPVAAMRRGWWAGGMLAAAVAVGLVVLAPSGPGSGPQAPIVATNAAVPSATAAGAELGGDAESFAQVFTPTADEDELI